LRTLLRFPLLLTTLNINISYKHINISYERSKVLSLMILNINISYKHVL